MAAQSRNPIRACIFDAYGTLFDFASAARRCRDVLGDSYDELTALWREKQLQLASRRTRKSRRFLAGDR
jgi:2-haloacid dehalogenase